ncbi:MAG: glutamine--fructose-6-phosphate transaminase (isomerizing) [Acidobacteria bacterium]|nr:MAG: glutamine--fructose-6-phosphate transaminase (isomerizing) [Acidobacteriota bacterium]
MPDKGGFPHYMLKEIFEQPKALEDTIAPRVSRETAEVRLAEEVRIGSEELRSIRRVNIVASGTSRHAGIAGQFMFQDLVHLPVDVDYASEFEYRNPMISRGEITIVITQSGETADTTAAQREAKKKGSRTIAISNVVGSTIAREADGVLYTHAGPEISIASTKAFTAQMAVLFLFAAYLAQVRGALSESERKKWIAELQALPKKTETVLEQAAECQRLADRFHKFESFLFCGRAIHYPVAMDGALKLKEVSYIHAEGYPTGETKHGPIAMIDESLPVVIIATCDRNDAGSVLRYEKNVANIRGFKQQSGKVIAIATEGDTELPGLADHTIFVPHAPELLSPILEIVPLQLFAYYMAVRKGLDVDRPRNLVKSVTLE